VEDNARKILRDYRRAASLANPPGAGIAHLHNTALGR
jgi:hypothetical protein